MIDIFNEKINKPDLSDFDTQYIACIKPNEQSMIYYVFSDGSLVAVELDDRYATEYIRKKLKIDAKQGLNFITGTAFVSTADIYEYLYLVTQDLKLIFPDELLILKIDKKNKDVQSIFKSKSKININHSDYLPSVLVNLSEECI